MTRYRAHKNPLTDKWTVEEWIVCINGLGAWFTYCTCDEPDESELGYTDGAIESAENRAFRIVRALDGS